MNKINKKIYRTIEFQNLIVALAFCLVCLIVFGALHISFLLRHNEKVMQILSILPCIIFLICTVWGAVSLISMTIKSSKYVFCEASDFSIAPDSKTLKGFFAINVSIENKIYTTKPIMNIDNFAKAEELKKIEIGIIEKDGESEIIVIKPN